MIKKITPTVFKEFCLKYFKERKFTYKNLRLGQAFLNKFYPNMTCPEIFYEENEEVAVSKIIDKFVDLDSESLLDILWKS